jgi:hypothetical protein
MSTKVSTKVLTTVAKNIQFSYLLLGSLPLLLSLPAFASHEHPLAHQSPAAIVASPAASDHHCDAKCDKGCENGACESHTSAAADSHAACACENDKKAGAIAPVVLKKDAKHSEHSDKKMPECCAP